MNRDLELLRSTFSDRYAVKREIGHGGMASVYLAEDLRHHRDVALKILRPDLVVGLAAARFLREIMIASGLTHPHIIPLYDSGEADGFLYYVMPYIEGESLRERLKRENQLPVDEAVRIACDVADALGYAHQHGVVHRDVKPENVLLEDGHPVVADFGIARAVKIAAGTRITETGIAVGTPAYMSPEQASGESEVDWSSDLYSLGCVLYEMLAGQPPFVGPNARAVMARHMIDTAPPLVTMRPGIPRNVTDAIRKALCKAKADRFGTMGEFAQALVTKGYQEEKPSPKSIAVLPFANLSPSREDEYLSDGITEEIMNALGKVRGLGVVSRTSAFAFKGKSQDVRTIGEQLGVASVLEGSVRRSGDKLRITAQLINVADGYNLWTERFDREMEDVFAIQDEIAQSIVCALRVILSEREKRALAKVPPSKIEAYEFYLRGRQFFHQTRRKSLQFAREMMSRAIEIDPNYAPAYAGLADACSLIHMYYPGTEAELKLADAASKKALELDPDLPEAHAARGFALSRTQNRRAEAEKEFQTAISLDPKQFEAYYFYGRTCFQEGRLEEAAQLFEGAARARDDYQAAFFLAQAYAALGRDDAARGAYERALEVVRKHLELNPDDPRAATICAVGLCRLGEREAGLEWAERALAIDPEDAGVSYNVACLYALEGETEKAIDCLEESGRVGFGHKDWIEHDPDLDSLRDHPRFKALIWPE